MLFWLLMTWSLTLAGLLRASANWKPHHYKQYVQKEEQFDNIGFNGKQFEESQKNTSCFDQTTPWNTWLLNAWIDEGLCNREDITWRKIEKKYSHQNCRNFANENWEVKFWRVQFLCNLGSSWFCHWRWLSHHVQAQIESPMITINSIKNEGPFENIGFNWKTVWRFRAIKRTETLFATFQKIQWNTRTLKASIEHGPRKQ